MRKNVEMAFSKNAEFYAEIGEKVKNLKGLKLKLLLPALLLMAKEAYSQITLEDIESNSKRGIKTLYNIAKWVITVVLIVGLITVIYMVVTNNPRSKEAVIGFVAALILVAIAYVLIPEPN